MKNSHAPFVVIINDVVVDRRKNWNKMVVERNLVKIEEREQVNAKKLISSSASLGKFLFLFHSDSITKRSQHLVNS